MMYQKAPRQFKEPTSQVTGIPEDIFPVGYIGGLNTGMRGLYPRTVQLSNPIIRTIPIEVEGESKLVRLIIYKAEITEENVDTCTIITKGGDIFVYKLFWGIIRYEGFKRSPERIGFVKENGEYIPLENHGNKYLQELQKRFKKKRNTEEEIDISGLVEQENQRLLENRTLAENI